MVIESLDECQKLRSVLLESCECDLCTPFRDSVLSALSDFERGCESVDSWWSGLSVAEKCEIFNFNYLPFNKQAKS